MGLAALPIGKASICLQGAFFLGGHGFLVDGLELDSKPSQHDVPVIPDAKYRCSRLL